MRKKSPGLAFTVSVLLWSATIWSWSGQESPAQTTINTVTAPGRVERAGNVMQIGTAASGIIAELLIREDVQVKAGQLLVRLDCASLQKELDARTSSLAATEAVLTRIVQGSRPEEVETVAANVRLAEARAEEARASLDRLAPSEKITVTEAQMDQAKRDAKIADAQVDEARAKLSLLKAGSRREDILEAQSRRDSARAFAEETATRFDQCSVRAPTDGIVLGVHVTRGQFVSSAVPVNLLTMVDSNKRLIRADVEERDLARICLKQQAMVTAEGFSDVPIEAVTERINEGLTRRAASNGNPTKKTDYDVREVILSMAEGKSNWPTGLRVSVKFAGCPADQSSARTNALGRP
jgi:multidrug resistance efflux pump